MPCKANIGCSNIFALMGDVIGWTNLVILRLFVQSSWFSMVFWMCEEMSVKLTMSLFPFLQ